MFEGEYLNGKRWNWKGYNKKSIIDFDIKNGKENNSDGLLIFEGEYLNGERNGKGKEYYIDGTLEFEGEYLNGERYGEGKSYNMKAN